MRVVGLMSGTSADGVDAALVEWPGDAAVRPFELLAYHEAPMPEALRSRIHRMAAAEVPGQDALRELLRLDVALGEAFAEAAAAVAAAAGVPLAEVDAIASHGQTVAHHPEDHATLQIGDPSVIAERTGRPVVADFRARDVAAGGEGAPLAPFFHHAAMASEEESRLVVNLGGMANVTWLPRGADPEAVVAFDVGPANAWLDGVIAAASAGTERFDASGSRAARGRVDEGLLAQLRDDPFFERPPPKSTGRERYGAAEARELWAEAQREGRSLDDLLATLVELSADCVARAHADHLHGRGGAPARVLLGGGGVRNRALVAALERSFPGVPVEPFDAVGVPADAAEAMAFSLMGRNAVLGLSNHLPGTTGALGARVLGEYVPGA